MPLWGQVSNTAHAPKMKNIVPGKTGANLYANSTISSFVGNAMVGVYSMNTAQSNTALYNQLPGWELIRHGTGPIVSAVANTGSGFSNGETFHIIGLNGAANATGTITTNATSNIASVSFGAAGSGAFSNSATINTTVQFHRQKHVVGLVVTNANQGYANTDYIVVSNGSVNARATFVTNGTGGFVTANVTVTEVGLFGNTAANATAVVTVYATNGAASNGTGNGTFSANLAASTGGAIGTFVLSGRANRVTYETLVAGRSFAANNSITIPSK